MKNVIFPSHFDGADNSLMYFDNQGKVLHGDIKILERVSDADRVWFEQHPERNIYVRWHVAGEWPFRSAPNGVAVIQMEVGVRLRLPLTIFAMPPDDEEVILESLRKTAQPDYFDMYLSVIEKANIRRRTAKL